MKVASQILLIVGMLMMVGGMTASGLKYREMKLQRHLHDRLCSIKLNLSEVSDWKTESFSVYRTGDHILYLTTVNAFGRQAIADSAAQPNPRYHGEFDVAIFDPSDQIFFQKHMT